MLEIAIALLAVVYGYFTSDCWGAGLALAVAALGFIQSEHVFLPLVILSAVVIGLCAYTFWRTLLGGDPASVLAELSASVALMFSVLFRATAAFR